MKIYELPMTRDYVSSWGTNEGVRELIQNALDSGSPPVLLWGRDGSGNVLHIKSEGARLPIRSMLLGATTKANDASKIGSFGEGYKLAMLVLLRAGKTVSVANDDELWEPSFGPSEQFVGEEVLRVAVSDELPPERALTFRVGGLTDEEVEGIREMCLLLQGNSALEGSIQTPMGDILPARAGKLYVGGLFVCKTGLRFGYNVRPQHLTLERDRNAVSSFDLKWLAKDMWFATGQIERVAEMISNNIPDMEHADYGAPQILKEEVFRIFQKMHPGKIAAHSMEDLRKQLAAGMSQDRIVYVGSTFGSVVRSSNQYKSMPLEQLTPPKLVLEEFLRENRAHMRRAGIVAFKDLVKKASGWKV